MFEGKGLRIKLRIVYGHPLLDDNECAYVNASKMRWPQSEFSQCSRFIEAQGTFLGNKRQLVIASTEFSCSE